MTNQEDRDLSSISLKNRIVDLVDSSVSLCRLRMSSICKQQPYNGTIIKCDKYYFNTEVIDARFHESSLCLDLCNLNA